MKAPTIELTNRVNNIDENTTVQTKIADIVVTDDALGSETLSVGGPNNSVFEIIGTELFLKAGQNIDFESLASLSVTVSVDDPSLGSSNDDSELLVLDVNDVNEAPTISLTNTVTSIAEDTDTSTRTRIADIQITDDALGSENLILSGADSARFEVIGSELFLRAGTMLDFESQPTFELSIELDDPTLGTGSEDVVALTLAVSNSNEAPTVSLINTVNLLPENFDTSSSVKIADIQINDDSLGEETLSLSGADAALFEIVGDELFLRANTTLDFEAQNQLERFRPC